MDCTASINLSVIWTRISKPWARGLESAHSCKACRKKKTIAACFDHPNSEQLNANHDFCQSTNEWSHGNHHASAIHLSPITEPQDLSCHQSGWHSFTSQRVNSIDVENMHRRRMHNTNCDCPIRQCRNDTKIMQYSTQTQMWTSHLLSIMYKRCLDNFFRQVGTCVGYRHRPICLGYKKCLQQCWHPLNFFFNLRVPLTPAIYCTPTTQALPGFLQFTKSPTKLHSRQVLQAYYNPA